MTHHQPPLRDPAMFSPTVTELPRRLEPSVSRHVPRRRPQSVPRELPANVFLLHPAVDHSAGLTAA